MDQAFQVSFEFFPPKTEKGLSRLQQVAQELLVFSPEYCSVTFGAGGSDQAATLHAVQALASLDRLECVPHISCVCLNKEQLSNMVNRYLALGIRRFVVLRGDRPESAVGVFDEWQHASELVAFMRQQWGSQLHLSVASYPEAHPESDDLTTDFNHFVAKVHCGADQAITQYFYNADAYFYLLEQCQRAGLTVPVKPGIMPLENFANIQRFSARCGAEIPRWIEKKMLSCATDPDAEFAAGVEVVTSLCERLLAGGAPSLHFYTLNKSRAVTAILARLAERGWRPQTVAAAESSVTPV